MSDFLSPDTRVALLQATQADGGKAAAKVNNAQKTKELEKIEGAAQEFEAVFVAEMMKPMFEGISTEAPFGGGHGEKIFRGMLLSEYGKLLAQTGEVGISQSVQEQLIKTQESSKNGQLNDE